MTNHFKHIACWIKRNLFPSRLTAGCDATHSQNAIASPRAQANVSCHCHNEPVSSIAPQPLAGVSAQGKPAPKHIPPTFESALPPYPDVWAYFLAKQYPDSEAEKFYDRFQMVSWESFGIKPIGHWRQLADQWMLNTQKEK